VSAAMRKGEMRHYDLWNERDGFFYSHLRYANGHSEERVERSLVGIIPFFACDVWSEEELKQYPNFYKAFLWFIEKKKEKASKCVQKIGGHYLLGILNPHQIERFLKYIWDPNEFRSEFGIRSLSKYHEANPAEMGGNLLTYEPGEAISVIKGGNSNWRGPIWFPINYLLVETLFRLGKILKDQVQVRIEGEKPVTLTEMGEQLSHRLLNLFKRDKEGKRPFFGDVSKFQNDPHFKDHFHFYEHFHAETGRGLGASHQNGWTGLIANLIEELREEGQ
jgi:hypothetical protein